VTQSAAMVGTSRRFGPAGEHPRPVWNRFDPADPLPEGMPFTTGSAAYRYGQVPFVFAIPYTAGLTVMHPGVAAGVDQHSDFRTHALARLLLTFDAAMQLTSNRRQEVVAMAEHVRRYHTTVHGLYGHGDGPRYAGSRYGANDTRLQAWVIWCIQRGVEQSYERWIAPMSSDEREALYRDIRAFGLGFGIPDEMLPADRRALSDYAEATIEADVLGGTSTSVNLVREVFRVELPAMPKALAMPARLAEAISVTFLDDPRLQAHFGLYPNRSDLRVARAFDLAMRGSWRHLPERLRLQALPAYLAVRRRIRRGLPAPPSTRQRATV
jgi:uncharacterized protein (DUF2236 family)